MKISEYPEEIRAFTEFACMVCMTEKRKGLERTILRSNRQGNIATTRKHMYMQR